MKKKFISCFFIIFFAVSFSFSIPPINSVDKCAHKSDSLRTETKKIDPVKEPLSCTKKDSEKQEGRNFTMMSLNLMYYLINKFITAPSFEQD